MGRRGGVGVGAHRVRAAEKVKVCGIAEPQHDGLEAFGAAKQVLHCFGVPGVAHARHAELGGRIGVPVRAEAAEIAARDSGAKHLLVAAREDDGHDSALPHDAPESRKQRDVELELAERVALQ